MTHLYVTHSIVGRKDLTNFLFDPDKPYRACLICGKVFQSHLDRIEDPTPQHVFEATVRRQLWAQEHAQTHPDHEHRLLKLSGRFCTPDAAIKLAPLGIAPVSDMVLSNEHEQAALEAPRAPHDDVEGMTKGGSSALL